METRFKAAVFISLAIHSIVMAPLFNKAPWKERLEKKDTITIDYVVIKEPKRLEAPEKKVEIKTKMIETPKVELKNKVDIKVNPDVRPQSEKKSEAVNDGSQDLAKRQARLKSTKDYVNYYKFIREKIRQRLKSNYKSYYQEGEVHLIFALNSDGSLATADLDDASSTSDKTLRDIAVSSIKEASPFPAFPKALNIPKMSFNLIILFKKQ